MRRAVQTSVLVLMTVLLSACAAAPTVVAPTVAAPTVAPPTVAPPTEAAPTEAAPTEPTSMSMINPGDKIGGFLVTTGQDGEIDYAWEQKCTQQGSAEVYDCPLTTKQKVNPTTGVFQEMAGQTLDSVWSEFTYELWIDGHPVNLAAFGSIDVPHPRAGKVRLWNVVLEADKPGEVVVHDKGKVSDKPFESTFTYTVAQHPFEGLAEWDVVVIGDSTLWGVAEPYAKLLEQDRGVKVNLHDEWQGGLSAGTILKALRNDFEHSAQREQWPQLVRDAEVLVFFGNPTDSLAPDVTATAWHCVGFTDEGQVELPPDAFEGYQADLGAIFDEIARLRAGRPLILRAAGIYNPVISVWRQKGFDDVCVPFWNLQNDAVRKAAEEHGVQFVDTYAAFNGASHDQDPRTKGYIRSDGEHPSEAGAQFYAGLLLQSGYDTWVDR